MNDMTEMKNLVLTGFMGTGKTEVGRVAASRLGLRFMDMDAIIEGQEGRSVKEIFAGEGEPYFREVESALCRELAGRGGLVIATGGGALVNEENLRALGESGLVVCLDCSPDALWERLRGVEDRPLLDAGDRRERILALMESRAGAYARIPTHVDTTGRGVVEVADDVLRAWFARGGTVDRMEVAAPGGSYPIYTAGGLLAHVGRLVAASMGQGGRCAVVSNDTVARLYAARLVDSLERAGFSPVVCRLPDGEEHKTLDTVRSLYDEFVAFGLDRHGAVIALGGGVVGDMAGFAAATYLRGVPFVQVPTTLLSMVDSSVGGKVGVDLPQGKNLVGAFKQPALVVIDPSVLDTLPREEYASGMAEVIKHGVIGGPELFAALETGLWDAGKMVREAVKVKIDVVQEDPYEHGRRAVLNLGHTFGHALEVLSGYNMRHGEAVAIGTVLAARLAERMGYAGPGLAERVGALMERHNLPTAPPPHDPAEVWRAMSTDKKRRGGRIRFVLPRAIGDVGVFEDVPQEEVTSLFREGSTWPGSGNRVQAR